MRKQNNEGQKYVKKPQGLKITHDAKQWGEIKKNNEERSRQDNLKQHYVPQNYMNKNYFKIIFTFH